MNLTPKQEKFCHTFIETSNASEAYRQSYNVSKTASANSIHVEACKLQSNPKVARRLNELRGALTLRSAITVDSLIAELEEARQVGKGKEQAQAMVAATLGKAKLMGFDRDNDGSDESALPVQIIVEVKDARKPDAKPE